MRLATLTTLAFVVLACARPEEKRQETYDTADLLELASFVGITTLPTDPAKISSLIPLIQQLTAILPPPGVLSVLETAVPPSVISELANPTLASSFASDFAIGSYPTWYSNLPVSVKNFFSTYSPTLNTRSTDPSVTPAPGLSSPGTTSGPGSVPSTSSSIPATISDPYSTISPITQSSGTPTIESVDQINAAPTAAVAAGAMGVIGVLGLALGL